MSDPNAQNGTTQPAQGKAVGMPKYRLTGPCYINETLYTQQMIDVAEANEKPILVFFKGIPNASMEAVNEAAEAMVKKHPLPTMQEAFNAMTPLKA